MTFKLVRKYRKRHQEAFFPFGQTTGQAIHTKRRRNYSKHHVLKTLRPGPLNATEQITNSKFRGAQKAKLEPQIPSETRASTHPNNIISKHI